MRLPYLGNPECRPTHKSGVLYLRTREPLGPLSTGLEPLMGLSRISLLKVEHEYTLCPWCYDEPRT